MTFVYNEQDFKDLIKKFNPFINKMILYYKYNHYFSEDDIISYSHMAIYDALKNAKQEKCTNSYFIAYIKNYILGAYRKNGNLISLRSKTFDKSPKIKKINRIVSFNAPVEKSTEGHELFLKDIIPSSVPTPYETIEKREDSSLILNEIIQLPMRSQDIINRHLINDESFSSIAKDYDISTQRVYQIFKAGMGKIRNKVKGALNE